MSKLTDSNLKCEVQFYSNPSCRLRVLCLKLEHVQPEQNGKRIHFNFCNQLSPGAKPKTCSDANFDDLLSGQGFAGTKEKKGPRTIAEMRKEEMAKEMDPEKLKARPIFSVCV